MTPSINVIEREKQYEITVELPGIEEKDIEVSVVNNELFINATKTIEKKENKENYHLRECSQGSFNRSIPLPYEVSVDAISATMKNGVLKVEIPKAPENSEKIKKISIRKG